MQMSFSFLSLSISLSFAEISHKNSLQQQSEIADVCLTGTLLLSAQYARTDVCALPEILVIILFFSSHINSRVIGRIS